MRWARSVEMVRRGVKRRDRARREMFWARWRMRGEVDVSGILSLSA